MSSHFEEVTECEFMLFFIATHYFPILKTVSQTLSRKRVFSEQFTTAFLCSGKGGYCTAVNGGLWGRFIGDCFAKLKPCREQGIIFYHGMMIEKRL